MARKRTILNVEQLESRLVPALTARYSGGSLYLNGSTVGELDITGDGNTPTTFTVTDNGNSVGSGSYTILGNLSITLTYRKGDIKIDLNGGQIPGNLIMDLGAGYTKAPVVPGTYSVDVYDSSGTGAGVIGGNVTILHGNGQELFNIGEMQTNPPGTLTQEPITINGALTVSAAKSSGNQGDGLRIGDRTGVFGTVTATQVDQVAVGSGATNAPLTFLGQDLSINDYGALRKLQVAVFAEVARNLSVTGTTLDDSFALQSDGTLGSGLVGGYLNVNLSDATTVNGLDNILVDVNTEIQGNATLAAGQNKNTGILATGDRFRVLGFFDQNLSVIMGNNVNSLYFTPANVGDPQPFVGGSMTVLAGNGINHIGQTATGEFTGVVVHDLTFHLGSGNNGTALDPMIIANQSIGGGDGGIGGLLTWTSTNGKDFLQLGDFGTNYNYNVSIQFGNKDDTFILDIGAGILTGTLDGGGRVTANIYTNMSGNDAGTTITNFP